MRKVKNVTFMSIILIAIMIIMPSCTKSHKVKQYPNWEKLILKQRSEKDKEFKTSPTSPMAGVARFTFDTAKPVWVGLNEEGKVDSKTSKFDGALIKIEFKDGQWIWSKIKNGFKATSDNKPVQAGRLKDETTFSVDRFTLQTYTSPKALVIIVFDPQRKEIKEFKHLCYYPPNHDYVVKGKLERLKALEIVKMVTSRNLIKTFYRYAKIHFVLNGKRLTLSAFKSNLTGRYSDILFIPFQDKTTGLTSYPAGRYLEIKEPSEDKITLDFNKAFNPLCNYSHAYNCPVPPAENILNVAIKAGEKIYPH